MASKKISELTAITPLLTDLVPLDRPATGAGAPVTGQATLADIQALIDTAGGGGENEYWESTVAGEIFATGSLVAVTGSLWAQFLSASNGLEITGSFTHGTNVTASGQYSHAQGYSTTASGDASHTEGASTTASGYASHAEGVNTTASGDYSHSEGASTTASGYASHAEGVATTASGDYSHAEGESAHAYGTGSHAEGIYTLALGTSAHSEGIYTTGSGDYSHVEGSGSISFGFASHAEGIFTIASGSGQLAAGKYNQRNNDFSLFVIGDGTADDDASRSDIVRVNSGPLPGSGSFEVTGSLSVTVGMTGSLSYTPGNGAYWADPDPTNVKDALDRIASLLYTLNSNTPIP